MVLRGTEQAFPHPPGAYKLPLPSDSFRGITSPRKYVKQTNSQLTHTRHVENGFLRTVALFPT